MGYQFKKHYTRDEARALLPQIRLWLQRLSDSRERLDRHDRRLASLLSGGRDAGGDTVNQWLKALAGINSPSCLSLSMV